MIKTRLISVTQTIAEELHYQILHKKAIFAHSQPTTLPKVLVNGSPRSGTTWTLGLIGSAPGLSLVGNFRHDLQRYRQVKPGAVIHGHEVYTPEITEILRAENIKVVLVIRDPRDITISRTFSIRRSINNPWHEQLVALPLEEAIMSCIEGYQGLYTAVEHANISSSWLGKPFHIHIAQYEKLRTDPETELGNIFKFLGISIEKPFLRAILVRNSFKRKTQGKRIWKPGRQPGQEDPNSFFRKGITGDWRNYFTPAHKKRFKELLGNSLIDMGYEKDYSW